MINYLLEKFRASRASLGLLVAAPALCAATAFGQDNPPANANSEATTERVIVTGSYIPTAETESALPVTVYTAEVLQKGGANTPVEGLRQLPSFVGNAITENDSNGGSGQATINLRAIGSQNALVLINGRRAFLGIGFNGLGPDISAIPISGTARTEVLKDGASAVYGSDAVAGVVNFIMLNGPGEAPYEGAEINVLYGNTTESDAHVRQAYIKGGVKTDKVAIAASAEYYSRANLYSHDRAQLAGSGDLSNDSTGLGRGGLNGNSPTYGGRIRVNIGPGALGAFQAVLVDETNTAPHAVVNGTDPAGYRNFENNPGEGATDPSRFNFRAFTPAIPAVEKAIWYTTGRYKIFGDAMQLYGDVMYAKTKQDNGLAASPFTSAQLQTSDGTLAGAAVVRASPFNPFGVRLPGPGEPAGPPIEVLTQTRYRFHTDEIGNRRSFFDNDYWRYVVGINGDFNFQGNSFISHFGYDVGYVYERFDDQKTDSGDADARPLSDQIVAGNFNPFIGQNAAVIGTAPIYNNTNPAAPQYKTGVSIGTAPYDNRTAAFAAAYLGHSFFYEASWLADAKANAHLFPNLWNGGIDIAMGYEHREDRQHTVPDPVQVAGFQLGFNAAPNTKFRQEVSSVFGELTIPFVTSTMNVPFVRSFEVSVAARYEEFDNFDLFHATPPIDEASFDNGVTPRVSIRYQPTPELTLRANWNQSFRSPTPAQLFTPAAQNFPILFDPLKFVTLQPPGGVFQQGNPDLQPEKTDAYSAGLVYTPKWVPGFTLTADWYQLYTKNVILPAANFAQILLTANGLSAVGNGGVPTVFTADVIRDAAGNLQQINNALTNNAGKRLVEGLDVTAVYELPTTNFGKFTFSLGWNHFFIWKAEGDASLAAGATNFLGNYNNGTAPLAPGAIPFNKGFLRGEWQWKGFDFVATGNYIGDFEDDPAFILGNQVLGGTIANPDFALHHRVSDYETLDLQLSYEFTKPQMEPAAGYSKDAKDAKSMVAGVENNGSFWQRMLWGTKLTVGCNNVFDRYPPTVLGAFNDNYDTSLYSIRNRYYYVSLSKKF